MRTLVPCQPMAEQMFVERRCLDWTARLPAASPIPAMPPALAVAMYLTEGGQVGRYPGRTGNRVGSREVAGTAAECAAANQGLP
jgi:hypothetical protein